MNTKITFHIIIIIVFDNNNSNRTSAQPFILKTQNKAKKILTMYLYVMIYIVLYNNGTKQSTNSLA